MRRSDIPEVCHLRVASLLSLGEKGGKANETRRVSFQLSRDGKIDPLPVVGQSRDQCLLFNLFIQFYPILSKFRVQRIPTGTKAYY